MADDPWLSWYGHPVLPAGYNDWEINGGDANFPGANEAIWPELFDTFEPKQIVLITEEMLEIFDGCADVVIPCENWSITFPREVRELMIRKRA